jgi:crotonobetainyl-CoA:carnitine CoA-transferase CaiB-like acyl-CoA transferase
VKFDGARTPGGSAPPELGQHTDQVMRELGFKRRDVTRLRKIGVI